MKQIRIQTPFYCCYKNNGSYYTNSNYLPIIIDVLTNYIVTDCTVRIGVCILRSRLGSLCSWQVSASVLSTGCCTWCICSCSCIWSSIGAILCRTTCTVDILTSTILLSGRDIGRVWSLTARWRVGSCPAIWWRWFVLSNGEQLNI